MSDDADGPRNPFGAVTDHWDRVMADLEATAEEYREAGWEALELHPGDVAVRESEAAPGLDVLVPDDEFEALAALIDEGVRFDEYRVYRGRGSGVVFLLVALEATEPERAVLCPAYFEADRTGSLRAAAEAADGLVTGVRRLSGERTITFEHDDPEAFFAEAAAEADDDVGADADAEAADADADADGEADGDRDADGDADADGA